MVPDNEDDLSNYFLYSRSLFNSPAKVFELQANRDQFIPNCVASASFENCQMRAEARLSGYFNYVLPSLSIRFMSSLLEKPERPRCEVMAYSESNGLLFLHFLAYVLAFVVAWKFRDSEFSKVLMIFLFVSVVTGPMIFNYHAGPRGEVLFHPLRILLPEVDDGFTPYVYVARGVLIQVFMIISALFISGRYSWIPFLSLIMIGVHATQAVTTNALIFGTVALFALTQRLMDRKTDPKILKMVAWLAASFAFNIFFAFFASIKSAFLYGIVDYQPSFQSLVRLKWIYPILLGAWLYGVRSWATGGNEAKKLAFRWGLMAFSGLALIEIFRLIWNFHGPSTDQTWGEITYRVEAAAIPILYGGVCAILLSLIAKLVSKIKWIERFASRSWIYAIALTLVFLLNLRWDVLRTHRHEGRLNVTSRRMFYCDQLKELKVSAEDASFKYWDEVDPSTQLKFILQQIYYVEGSFQPERRERPSQ